MRIALSRGILPVILAILLALASIASARHMAPDPAAFAREQAAIALGLAPADLCGEGMAHGSHHRVDCPFCHKLPWAPLPRAPGATPMSRPAPQGAVRTSRAVPPDRFDHATAPRAPPAIS